MKRRALLIGIDSYHMLGDLKYARRDAEAFGSALQERCGFDSSYVTLMTCQAEGGLRANSRYIEHALNDLQKERDLDLLIVGFWGHGFAPQPGRRYLCGVETSEDDLERTAVSLDLVQAKLTQVQARDTLVILDCCQNQPAGRSAAAEPLSKGEETAMGSMARDIQAARMEGESLSVPTVAVLSACREGQKAYEWDTREHGIFTAHLLDGLQQGVTSVAQLSNHTFDRVVRTANELHHQRQTPYFTIEGRGDIEITQQAIAPQPGPPSRRQESPKPPPREKLKQLWWAIINGRERGPLTKEAIISLVNDGKLTGKSDVWREDFAAWRTAESYDELKR
ncbi:MAG: caspase family protein, partial [Planctomycetes bacterium]|nr:caspase family protein [Planctomycetota bacterium]